MADVNVDFVFQPDVVFTADLRIVTAIKEHGQLEGRDEPDQHSISSITGLQEELDRANTFVYEQCTSSDTWVITHNLNKHPSVTVVDSAGNEIYPEVNYDSENQCTIKTNGATTGKAYLN